MPRWLFMLILFMSMPVLANIDRNALIGKCSAQSSITSQTLSKRGLQFFKSGTMTQTVHILYGQKSEYVYQFEMLNASLK